MFYLMSTSKRQLNPSVIDAGGEDARTHGPEADR